MVIVFGVAESKSEVGFSKLRRLIFIKGQKWKLAKLRVVRNIEWTKNLKIAHLWSQNFVCQIENILEIC